MSRRGSIRALGLLLALAGCVPSLHPLYTEKDLVEEPAVVGTWTNGKETYLIERKGEKEYLLTYRKEEEAAVYRMRLLRLEKLLFADLYPADAALPSGLYAGSVVPAHTFYRLEAGKDALRFALAIDPEWFKALDGKERAAVRHEEVGEGKDPMLVFTDGTAAMQKLALRRAQAPGVSDWEELRRPGSSEGAK